MSYTTGAEMDKRKNGGAYTLEQALKKIYLIKWGHLSVPRILVGKRVRLAMVDDEI